MVTVFRRVGSNLGLKPGVLSMPVIRKVSSGSRQSQLAAIEVGEYGKALRLSTMPGPGGLAKLPYIGPLFLFHPFSPYKPETYGALVSSLHDKYGPVFKTRLGTQYTVHTCSIEDIERIFHQEPVYPARRLNILNQVFRQRRGLPQGLGTCNGPEWHALRTSLNAPLNRPRACMEYLPAQNKVTDDFIQQLLKVDEGEKGLSSAETVFDLLFRFSAESAAVVCFNQRMGLLGDSNEPPESRELLHAIYTHLNSSFKAMIGLERKFLKTENDTFYQNYAAAMDCIRKESTRYLNKTFAVAQQSEGKPDTESKNMLMSLTKNTELNLQHILAIIESLMIAGTDSTARNLSVLFYNLARHPDVQEKLRKEVIAVLGKHGPITSESLTHMRFLKACVKESMRLYPPISPGPERTLPQDTVLSGYLVPEGTSVIMASVKTSRNPEFFPDHDTFRPDRWMRHHGKTTLMGTPSNADARLAALAVLPFGHGKRSCVGRRFAELEIYVCVAKLLQKLSVSIDSEYGELETMYTPFVTPVKTIPFIFKKL